MHIMTKQDLLTEGNIQIQTKSNPKDIRACISSYNLLELLTLFLKMNLCKLNLNKKKN